MMKDNYKSFENISLDPNMNKALIDHSVNFLF
jgi:hypothetical protein